MHVHVSVTVHKSSHVDGKSREQQVNLTTCLKQTYTEESWAAVLKQQKCVCFWLILVCEDALIEGQPQQSESYCILPYPLATKAAFLLTGSVESDFVLVGMFEQVLSVVELSSLEPFWDIWDPFGYIHNLEYTPTKHTWEGCSSDDCISTLSALNTILIPDVLNTFWL